jgi:uncharacterized membrane protein
MPVTSLWTSENVPSIELAVEQKLPQRGFSHAFSRIASKIAEFTGRPWAFLTAMLVIVVWAITGPIFGFSDTWQLVNKHGERPL